ncbi:hypothetical protein HELRODRAFT_168546 [Helobdella robusta]|uniref:ENTH domain-containing protein n=1 Tax=Helobdella robusta TaxID=6412 RepID=T1F0P7_HELRO|nr:hypothetical protein HELRODRAFT_168546 [Helobdella robusta]ESO09545.1 hypothetical protein HELRODRAFT_168546 [Helobdella robusta]
MVEPSSPMHQDNPPQRNLPVFNRTKRYASTFSRIAFNRQQDNNDAESTHKIGVNHRGDGRVYSSQRQLGAFKSIRKRKLFGKRVSEIPFTISDDSDDDVDNKSYYNASQYFFQNQNLHHSHRRYKHNQSHSNCCYTDAEKRRKVLLKSITSINDVDARSKISICDNTFDDNRDQRWMTPSSDRSKLTRRCSSVMSFRQLLASADMTDNCNGIDDSGMLLNNNNYKNSSPKRTMENFKTHQNEEFFGKLDRMRTNLANNCLSKFGKHCIPLMKALNKDNTYNNILEAHIGPIKNDNKRQANFVKGLLLSKHLTNVTKGLYISCTLQSTGKILVTSHNLLPTVNVDSENVADLESHFFWLMKVTSDWSLLTNIKQAMKKEVPSCKKTEQNSFLFKYAILKAVNILQKITGNEKLGHLHTNILSGTDCNVFMFINNDFNAKSKSSLNSSPVPSSSLPTLSWMPLGKLSSSSTVPNKKQKISGMLNDLTSNCKNFLRESKNLDEQLKSGVYISYMYLACHLQHGMQILVSRQTPNNFPSTRIDDYPSSGNNTQTTDSCLKILNGLQSNKFDDMEDNFKSMICSKIRQFEDATYAQLPFTLETSLASSPSSETQKTKRDKPVEAICNRLHTSILHLNDQVKMILLAPPHSLFCPLITQDAISPLPDSFFLPMRTFEMIQLRTYQPQIYQKYCQLSVILELALEICKSRKTALDAGSKQPEGEYRSAMLSVNAKLSELKRDIEDTWTRYRWIGDAIKEARFQIIFDKIVTVKHTITGQDYARSILKATTDEIAAPKKKHLDC